MTLILAQRKGNRSPPVVRGEALYLVIARQLQQLFVTFVEIDVASEAECRDNLLNEKDNNQ